MSNSIVSQVPKNLLFRYRLACKKCEGLKNGKFVLDESYRLPDLGQFEKQPKFADVRVAWNENGLFLTCEVKGKKQSLWCRESQLLESDGIQVWIDTRDTHNVHRATKFCHWFMLCPSGGVDDETMDSTNLPMANMLKINRSREDSPMINRAKPEVAATVGKDGYHLSAFLSAKCLHGWDTSDHRSLGFNFAVVDRELSWQTLAIGPELPIMEDPSLWQTLQLIEG